MNYLQTNFIGEVCISKIVDHLITQILASKWSDSTQHFLNRACLTANEIEVLYLSDKTSETDRFYFKKRQTWLTLSKALLR